jgi:Holliday junction resolvase RusA-like endonuclease
VKMLTDELVRWRFIESDQLICELVARKFIGETPGIRVALAPKEAA